MRLAEHLSILTGLSQSDLVSIIETAPRRYKSYPIKKKNGDDRIIAQPAKEVKIIQRLILDHYLTKFPVHRAAAAYVKNRGIRQNAESHLASNWFLKLDFTEFFPSIKSRDWIRFLHLYNNDVFQQIDYDVSAKILFWGQGSDRPKVLSIGAPTSPQISNILLFDFDSQVATVARAHKVSYTRYADDITLSAMEYPALLQVEGAIRDIIKGLVFPRLKLNEAKRGLFSKGNRRMVTGLVVTPQGQVSLGRERKRLISAMLNRLRKDLLDEEAKAKLKGLLGFALANEAAFVSRMRAKYSDDLVTSALRFHVRSRKDRGLN